MEERSLAETPTWLVACVVSTLIGFGLIITRSIVRLNKWLIVTKRKALLAATEAIMEELMVFGVLSLLLGHGAEWISRICVKQTAWSTDFYPCIDGDRPALDRHAANRSARHGVCPEDLKPFVSYESTGQLHRLLLVLVIVHVSYCFFTVSVAMLKIYSWRKWEAQAESSSFHYLQNDAETSVSFREEKVVKIKRQYSFISQHTFNPCLGSKVLVLMVCLIGQFWGSIDKADYMALRFGFLYNHNLHLSYNFHNYMLRSMEDEFRDIVGISLPLWGYSILCILLNIHGTNAYFWLSFIPAVLIVIVGTKLHHVVLHLALDVSDDNKCKEHLFKPRDELFWFRKPKLLLWLIQLISFQNAFGMATLIWSLWEIKTFPCFMKKHSFVVIRLISGILYQFWCSYRTFPLYVIVTQMGSKTKKALFPESIRKSLHRWSRRAKRRHRKRMKDRSLSVGTSLTTASSFASLDWATDKIDEMCNASLINSCMNMSNLCKQASEPNEISELYPGGDPL